MKQIIIDNLLLLWDGRERGQRLPRQWDAPRPGRLTGGGGQGCQETTTAAAGPGNERDRGGGRGGERE